MKVIRRGGARGTWRRRLAVLGASFVLVLLVTELVFRLLAWQGGLSEEFSSFQRFLDQGLAFEARAYIVYARPADQRGSNQDGFSDDDWRVERTPGVLRVACLGGSTTEGGNEHGQQGSYPWLLSEELELRLGREVEVMNCGIAGWTTAETLCAWFLLLQDFAPDAIVIHHAVNDVMPRNQPGFQRDYSHWRRAWDGEFGGSFRHWLCRTSTFFAFVSMPRRTITIVDLTSVPPVRPMPYAALGHLPLGTELPFRRNVERIGIAAGGQGIDVLLLTMPVQPRELPGADGASSFRDGVAQHNQLLRELAQEHGWGLVDAAPFPEQDLELAAEVFLDLVHLTRRGNRAKARLVADELVARWRANGILPASGGDLAPARATTDAR